MKKVGAILGFVLYLSFIVWVGKYLREDLERYYGISSK